MSEKITSNAIIYAILALNSEVSLQREYLDSEELPEEDKENEMEILQDLEQAFMEFIDVYKHRCKSDKDLPSIDELLNSEI
jgi:RecB family exonuclease